MWVWNGLQHLRRWECTLGGPRKIVSGPDSGKRLYCGFFDSHQLISLPVEIPDSTFDSLLLSYNKTCPQPPRPAAPPVSKEVVNGELWGDGESKPRFSIFLVTWRDGDRTLPFHFHWPWINSGERTPPGLQLGGLLCLSPIKQKTIWRIPLSGLFVCVPGSSKMFWGAFKSLSYKIKIPP